MASELFTARTLLSHCPILQTEKTHWLHLPSWVLRSLLLICLYPIERVCLTLILRVVLLLGIGRWAPCDRVVVTLGSLVERRPVEVVGFYHPNRPCLLLVLLIRPRERSISWNRIILHISVVTRKPWLCMTCVQWCAYTHWSLECWLVTHRSVLAKYFHAICHHDTKSVNLSFIDPCWLIAIGYNKETLTDLTSL